MKITILTMFPQSFSSLMTFPVIKRAVDRGLLTLEIKDIKDYAGGSFRHIDDSPCGGGGSRQAYGEGDWLLHCPLSHGQRP